MQKIYLALMCIVSLVIMTACGGGNKNNNAADGKAEVTTKKVEIKNVNAENWVDVIASNFGLAVSLPESWGVKSAKSQNGFNNIEVVLSVGGTATYTTFGDALFAELKKDASGDIKKYGGTEVYSTFAEAAGKSGIASFTANVDGSSGKSVIINYFDNGATVKMTLMRLGTWK